jgi:hypothetical protein
MATPDKRAKAEAFKTEVQQKIQGLIAEFAEGKISREQFNVLYERYNGQLQIAEHALLSGNPDAVKIAQAGPSTVMVKDALMGKAIGLAIYHNKSGTMVDTLGNFDVPVTLISSVLNDFSMMMQDNKLIDRRVQKVSSKQWLLFAAGKFTTIVTLFQNEPSQQQSREMERLQHDFEEANRAFLQKEQVDKDKLAYPFLSFVQQKLKKSP